jgi:putative ABC transport system ATP-binding protein
MITPGPLLDGVTKTDVSKAGRTDALRGISHVVGFTVVMGPTGSSKSTLPQCAAGPDRPTSGTVMLSGTHMARPTRWS